MWKRLSSNIQQFRLKRIPVTVFGRPVDNRRLIVALALTISAIALIVVFSRSVTRPVPPAEESHLASSRQEVLEQLQEQLIRPDPEPAAVGPVRPVPGPVVVPFGWMYSPVHRDWRLHTGVDLAAEAGEPVVSLSAGTVLKVSGDPEVGMDVIVDHPGIGELTYRNVRSPEVRAGDRLAPGQVLGVVGDCRVCLGDIGVHLHIECRIDGELVDVAPFLPVPNQN